MTEVKGLSGGCQCGAVRYRASDFGRSSVCHCRMCQKALGSPYATLVTARDLTYTRGKPTYFQSSNKVRRGFCGVCGTPLTYEFDGFDPDITVSTLDDPNAMPPVVQLAVESRLPWGEGVSQLPQQDSALVARAIRSHQHPDHDTAEWPPQED